MNTYIKGKHRKKPSKILCILVKLFLILFLLTIIYFLYGWYSSYKNKKIYEEIKREIIEENNQYEKDETSGSINKVINLKRRYPEIVGWIKVEGTIINYPILQSDDNKYYLTHNYKKRYSQYGSIFTKKECNINNLFSNTIIYGHNMKDGQMFNQLLKYENEEFYKKNKFIEITTEQERIKYAIIVVFKSRVYYKNEKNVFKFYDYINLENKTTYNYFIENCYKKQLYNTGLSAEYGEQLITLVTCEYSQKNGRLVIVAKRI